MSPDSTPKPTEKSEPTWDSLVEGTHNAATSKDSSELSNRFDLPKEEEKSPETFAPGKHERDLSHGGTLGGILSAEVFLGGESGRAVYLSGHPETNAFFISTPGRGKTIPNQDKRFTRVAHPGFTISIQEGETIILGKEMDPSLGFGFTDGSPESDIVSRRHVAISVKNSKFFIEDLNSTNGTQVLFTIPEKLSA